MSVIKATLPTGQLRSKLEGIDIPVGFKLPELDLVLKDAAEAREMMGSPPPPPIEGQNAKGESIGTLPIALVYNMMFSNLFKFAYFCEVEDVPPEILPQCIWALEWFIRALTDGSELQLRTLGHILPHQKVNEACYFMSSNARYKAASHALKPEIDKPLEALRHLHDGMEADKQRMGGKIDMWKTNPGSFFMHAVALARSRTNDIQAEQDLSRIINDKNSQNILFLVKSKVYLSRTFRRLGKGANAQELEQWLVQWLKKNPHHLPDSSLIEIFTTDTDTEKDPILVGIVNLVNPMSKLSQCSRCKHIYYCSKECQVAHFPYHKVACREHAAQLKAITGMAPDKALIASDWYTWRVSPVPANTISLVHALGLHRDPSRSRTHIVFKHVEYVPNSKSRRDRFKVVGAGVYKLDDVWQDIETSMALRKNEGKTYIKEMLEEFDVSTGQDMLPMLDFMFGSQEIQTYLGIRISKAQIQGYPYDPNWKNSLNTASEAVGPLKLRSAAKDSEKVF
ncbi:hypothetical protein BDP27DRAFT_1415268 [Rhodocollybia butyracea]|uniref:MYND-type domain-containing protein n=1 Tax=Rhodocollybia butyracea TaxID=206335 RepID=A0A9P5UDS2_9AGAR|nr:hypothetical protein BDP27DRAFT_1415268 [Rhodocollybia butyracea]